MEAALAEDTFEGALFPPPSPDQITAEFRAQVAALKSTPAELAARMHQLGDYRPHSTILRSLQRMLSGEIRVAGEMKALVTMMLRQQRRLEQQVASLSWRRLPDGSYSARAGDFQITLAPRTRGRWHVVVFHKDGYSPDFPRWQVSLADAKLKALICAENAAEDLAEREIERAAEACEL